MKLKVLIVEDNILRLQRMQAWAPDVHFVWARSAGAAFRILKRDHGQVYQAVLLDHDLDTSTIVASDHGKDGRDVVKSVIRYISASVPVLVHSTNKEYGHVMASQLEQAGFYTEHISMNDLTKAAFLEFLDYARDAWEHPTGGIGAGNH